MSEVAVQRCVLRIRRTAGWAWGAAPDELLAAATRVLPALIAARLPAIASAASSDVRIAAPVRVRIEATIAELAELAALAEREDAASALGGTPIAGRVGAALEEAIARALEHGAVLERPAEPASEAAGRAPVAPSEDHARGPAAIARRAAAAWWSTGAIDRILARLELRGALALHARLLPEGPACSPPAALVSELARIDASRPPVDATPIAILRRRIALAAAAIAAGGAASAAELRAAIDAVIAAPAIEPEAAAPASSGPPPSMVGAPAAAPGEGEGRREPAAEPTAAAVGHAARRLGTEIEVWSVLPFLLLPPLHHARWLDAVSALCALHEVGDAAAVAIAAGLAGKVLDPPERGWLRTRADRALIAAFAGTDEPIGDEQLAATAGGLAPVLAGLDDLLRATIGRVRAPSAPVLLSRGARGWMLLDLDGLAVLAVDAALPPVLAAAGAALVLVPSSCADPVTLDRIDLANLRFLTDAASTRDEPWRSIAGLDRRLWTNDTSTPAGLLAAAAGDLDRTHALARELAEELDARSALARDPSAALESTCTLAATAALADLGARLFPTEPATPILALARFRDLDARVRFDADAVRVRIPLGRRHADLMRHGFLTTIPHVPWLGGRALDLGGA